MGKIGDSLFCRKVLWFSSFGKGKNMGDVVIYITLYHVTTAEPDSVTLSLVFTLVQCHTLKLCREEM